MKSNQIFSNHQKRKCFFSWVLVILFFIVIPVFSQPQKGWVQFSTGKADKPTKAYMKDETTSGMLVNFDVPGIFVYEVKKDGTVYQRLTIPGKGTTTEIGKPELPVVGEVLEVPHGVDFNVEIYKSDYKILDGYVVYPYQPPPIDEDENSEFKKDEAAYSKDAFYPKELALITSRDIAVIRGHRIVLLKANPIQYNPVTKQLKVYSNIEARIKYSKPAQVRKIDRRLVSKSFEELMERTVLNYKKVNRFDWISYEKYDQYQYLKVGRLPKGMFDLIGSYWKPGNVTKENFDDDDDDDNNFSGCEYLIITTNTFYNDADPNNPVLRLRNWKRQKGLSTEVVLLQDIPDSDNDTDIDEEDISSYIEDAYNTWSPPPTYILLIGDAGDNAGNPIIPTHYKSPDPSHNDTLRAADIYFVTVDGNDYFPDIFLGRLSVDTQAQAEDVIDKIIDYEQNPPGAANAAFYTDAALLALFEDDDPEDGIEDKPWIGTVEEMRNYLINNDYNVDRIYTRSAPGTDPLQYENLTALPNDLLVTNGFQWNGGANDISNAINNGRFLVTFRDHGGQDEWSHPNFTIANVNNLTNGNLTPVVISLACQTGWFDNESDDDANLDAIEQTGNNDECFCEHFLRHNNGGAVAILGATRNSKTPYNDYLGFGCYKAIWPDFDPNPPFKATRPPIPDVTSGPLLRMGQVMTFGKIFMANAYTDSDNRKESFEEYLVFGDPEMPIWTEMPGNLSVHHPAGIGSTGPQDFVVKVKDQANDPVNNAIVCLTRDGEIISSRMTDAGGIARFTRSFSSGNLDITVTALGFRPYTGIIEVTANGAHLNRLDPDNGIKGQSFNVGGENFSGNENIRIYLDDQQMLVHQASAGEFGQSGVEDVPVTIPNNYENGLYNVILEGENSGRFAVDVFQVRDQNPVDLYTYSQWDDTTWSLHPGDNPTWNNPEIQLYDENDDPVQSNNLTVGNQYRIVAKIYNSSNFNAQNASVTFKWANYGAAQKTWNVIDTDHIDVDANNSADAEVMWAPPITGHLCLRVFIYHAEDDNADNNNGQENCDVSPTSSPAVVPFKVWNPTKKAAALYFEVRQLYLNNPRKTGKIWKTEIRHPDPQIIPPGGEEDVEIVIDPHHIYIEPGTPTEFAVTCFLNGKIYGGVNMQVIKALDRFSFSIHGGFVQPINRMRNYYSPGLCLFLDFAYHITRHFSFVGLVGINYFSQNKATSDPGDKFWLNINLDAQVRVPLVNPLSIYFRSGGGYYLSLGGGTKKFGINSGTGLLYGINNSISLGLGVDYHHIPKGINFENAAPIDLRKNLNFIQAHLGLIFNF